jgi:hypothetical protein
MPDLPPARRGDDAYVDGTKFPAIVAGIGIAGVVMQHSAVGAALVFAGVGSMAAAAIVRLDLRVM